MLLKRPPNVSAFLSSQLTPSDGPKTQPDELRPTDPQNLASLHQLNWRMASVALR